MAAKKKPKASYPEFHYYAGIGSREAPKSILEAMEQLGQFMASKGYILFSGGEKGPEQAFEKGCDLAGGQKMIYLPSQGYNDHPSCFHGVEDKGLAVARANHATWDTLSEAARPLVARQSYVVLGYHTKFPVDFVICWTADGRVGGTGSQAMRIAQKYDIPIYNLKKEFKIPQLGINWTPD